MKRTLKIQEYLRIHGLQKTVEDFALLYKEKDDLVLFKYKQNESDFSKEEVRECRGLILDKSNNWEVVAYSYDKFFNIGEGNCATINWDNAKFYEKLDGSLINFYYYKDKWHVQTSGTIDAEASTNEPTLSFAQVIWKTVDEMYGIDNFLASLDVNYNYMFELCTPYNIVITQHTENLMYLHGVRDMRTYEWLDIDKFEYLKAKTYDLKSVDDMLASFENMTWQEEGFVVFDGVNRVKCKNPKYVEVHHVATGVSPFSIINVIKTNEVDEYLSYFSGQTETVRMYEKKWKELLSYITERYNELNKIQDQKEFALTLIKSDIPKIYHGTFFNYRNGNIKSIYEGLCNIEHRYYYYLFNDKLEMYKK